MTHPSAENLDSGFSPLPAWRTGHDVHFYDDEAGLQPTLSRFVIEGALAGQPMVMVCTPARRQRIENDLLLVPAERRDEVDITWLDAHDTLAAFMEADRPSAELFRDTIGNVFERVMATRRYVVIRAYGEMVDLLWNAGNVDGAVALEQMWNDLAARYSFNLLCSYSHGTSLRNAANDAFRRICAHHGSVIPPAN
jgi:hypothetical protein